ncbi:Ribonucleoside-diphosphate reductase NrdZ [Sporotomaculum syntrophicum]|uniref:Vitamin B12-dependent ribonucleotide reductase n=1 Tax=Sporotomaculum syntrophicum TaxID=182264 RepID=A0A9D2WNW6_9FIRM|nr:adenosylcobalamin-dependent ribonucleoside-diphosphate reductase [Sporotomaculum syntrophicum]KAF1084744.1 Ribonucleoside-diphosphate reductase NrdZ [Sporotomaculum syntrophicum]
MQLSANGQKVFDARYAGKDENGQINETFPQAVHRLATTASIVEQDQHYWTTKFTDVIGNLLFVPSTPIWANVGKTDRPWQPGACFVLAVEDSLHSMYDVLHQTAMIFKSGGGTGYNFSSIRPKGDLVHSTKGQASGVVELIRLYNASANMVMQGGVRRGASLGILNIDHPEIKDFINAKLNGDLTNFNLSVGVIDAFMDALNQGAAWELKFNGKVYETIAATELWDMLIWAAHACGDPGIIFLDQIQRANPVPGKVMNATNPCGEQPLYPGESCLLGSVNLAKMVKAGAVDWDLLRDTVSLAVKFLDNLIDVAEYPLPLVDQNTKSTRKIGLGFTGLADALIMANLAYDSPEGRSFAGELTRFIQQTAHETSRELAEEKGCFPDWENSIYYPHEKRRNAACITIAPTGSVTAMAGCEGYGVEPIFAVAYTKQTKVAGDFEVFSPLFLEACQRRGVTADVLTEVAQRGTCQGVTGIPRDIQQIFKGAQDIAPRDHIKMQVAVQKNTDNAVSKTINLPNSATVNDIDKSYRLAYQLGLKGITVFRDGCKEGVITVGEGKPRTAASVTRGEIIPRPQNTIGKTYRLDTGCGKLYLTVNWDNNGNIIETFITTGSDGGCLVYTEATSRLISLAIRGGISVDKIIEQLQSTHPCPNYMMARGKGKQLSPGKSCAGAIAKQLTAILREEGLAHEQPPVQFEPSGQLCEVCGTVMLPVEGCYSCPECGNSHC